MIQFRSTSLLTLKLHTRPTLISIAVQILQAIRAPSLQDVNLFVLIVTRSSLRALHDSSFAGVDFARYPQLESVIVDYLTVYDVLA